MGTGQGPIKIQSGNDLDVGDTTSNVATNKAELAALAANIDGKDTYPQSVSTQRLQVAQTLSIGDQVQLTDGCVKSNHLTTDSAVITDSLQIGNNVITEDAISVPNLSSVNANLGTITGGSLSIGSGGVTVSGGSGGVYIGGNQIFLGTAGSPTVLLDGATGIITASKFQLTADATSSVDMSLGSLTIGGGTSVDGTTTIGTIASDASQAASDASAALGAAAAALEVADGEIVGYYQNDAPASGMKFGDIWIDTNYAGFPTTSAIYRYQDTSGGSSGTLAWRAAPNNAIGKVYLNAYTAQSTATGAANTAASKITTFYQTSAPTALATGDLWVDTDDGNKLYRWSGYSWVSVQDSGAAAGSTAIQPGNGFTVDANKYPNTITLNSGGISIQTAASGSARVVLNNSGLGVYNSSNVLKTVIDTGGLKIRNASGGSPSAEEEISFCNSSGTTKGIIFWDSASDIFYFGANKDLYLSASSVSAGHVKIYDDRTHNSSSGTPQKVPVIVAGTTSVSVSSGIGSASISWSPFNTAPTAVVATCVASSGASSNYVASVATPSSTGGTVYVCQVDGTSGSGSKTVHWAAIWV